MAKEKDMSVDQTTKTTELNPAAGDPVADTLRKQDQILVRIPVRPDVKQKFVMVWVNGHSYQIERGKDVMVPKTVRDILIEAGEI